jgi:hypothetical protein
VSHNRWKVWQEREGGPLVTPKSSTHPWYNLSAWRKGFRIAELQRHPICRQCERAEAKIVDHVVTFIDKAGIVSWALFSDPSNHKALCVPCHSRLTATYDRGFGNPGKAGKEFHMQATGDGGRQFISSSISSKKLDAAMDFDVAALLKDIPK